MNMHKRVICGVALLALALLGPAPAAAADEARIGVVQEVDAEAGIVVIDGNRYRSYGRQVQPPPDVASESRDYETRPFERGMIVRYTLQPGNPPIIGEAWSID